MITIPYNYSIFFNTFITAGLQLLRVSRRSMNKLLRRRVQIQKLPCNQQVALNSLEEQQGLDLQSIPSSSK